ncbi:hypothetical protein CAEBREN_30618 [Caenorhabditis brenneri]|uniref:Uncharacterized protein n=1 Tax=Caenorhabditis brenneri TaxID=135651 RepID=G0N7G9_CAEBE|nr:hypothetical protein CAEBREN_30618 [Caenorhabditis brenneri]
MVLTVTGDDPSVTSHSNAFSDAEGCKNTRVG